MTYCERCHRPKGENPLCRCDHLGKDLLQRIDDVRRSAELFLNDCADEDELYKKQMFDSLLNEQRHMDPRPRMSNVKASEEFDKDQMIEMCKTSIHSLNKERSEKRNKRFDITTTMQFASNEDMHTIRTDAEKIDRELESMDNQIIRFETLLDHLEGRNNHVHIELDDVLPRIDMFDLLTRYIPEGNVKVHGDNIKTLCPFHNEKTPSFSASQSKKLWNCFGCGEKGNAIQFVMRLEDVNFVNALKTLNSFYP